MWGMKKMAILLCVLLGTTPTGAQRRHGDNTPEGFAGLPGVEFRHFAYTRQKIALAGENTLVFAPVTRGIAFTTGHSFLVHERPLARIIRFGFDAAWFDIEYGNWQKRIDNHKKWLHKLDLGIGIGPAVHLSPFDRLGVHAYFRYNPTLSLVAHNFAGDEEGKFELVTGYASYFSTGLSVSWSAFSVGGEVRYGRGTYRGVRIPDVTLPPENLLALPDLATLPELPDLDMKDALDKQRHRMNGWRIYLSFRF